MLGAVFFSQQVNFSTNTSKDLETVLLIVTLIKREMYCYRNNLKFVSNFSLAASVLSKS